MDHDALQHAACAACDLAARLNTDLASARRALADAEQRLERALDLALDQGASHSTDVAAQVRHNRVRVAALEQVLGDLTSGHGGCDAA
jgi:uncharacterized protein involved in exopolysaccharide biosynthesis